MKKELKIGLLAIIVMVVSFFVINFLRGRDVFNKESEFTGRFHDVEGLVASAPVQVRGYVAGHVQDVRYCPETDDFEVVCSVKKEFKIPEDSRIVIYSTSIMGTKGVRIDCGQSETCAKSGDTLQGASDADLISSLSEAVTPLLGKLGSTLDSLETVVSNVNAILGETNRKSLESSLKHLNRTLASASELAASLGGKSEEVNMIVDNLSKLSEKLAPIAESAQSTLDNLDAVTGQLNEADIKGAVSNISKAADGLGKTVKEVEEPLNSLLNDVDDLVKSIKENPKKYIKVTVF